MPKRTPPVVEVDAAPKRVLPKGAVVLGGPDSAGLLEGNNEGAAGPEVVFANIPDVGLKLWPIPIGWGGFPAGVVEGIAPKSPGPA